MDNGRTSAARRSSGAPARLTAGPAPLRTFDVRELGVPEFESSSARDAEIVVVIPLFNYRSTITECLESVVDQDLENLSVVIVDDGSTDDGPKRVCDFLKRHLERFATARLIRHRRNQGLSMARNSGIAWSSEPYLFMLDADNRIRRPALTRLLAALKHSRAAFAYSQLRMFGSEDGFGLADVWEPARLRTGNYIDAMALLRRDALLSVGGYSPLANEYGWEDYDLWCSLAEMGQEGVFVPEILCEYRVHGGSMLRTRTNKHSHVLMSELMLRHPVLFDKTVDEETPEPADEALE
jgi:glycosyltransferase involved in cell wall biosynthesis